MLEPGCKKLCKRLDGAKRASENKIASFKKSLVPWVAIRCARNIF